MELLTTFVINTPADTPGEAVDDTEEAEAERVLSHHMNGCFADLREGAPDEI